MPRILLKVRNFEQGNGLNEVRCTSDLFNSSMSFQSVPSDTVSFHYSFHKGNNEKSRERSCWGRHVLKIELLRPRIDVFSGKIETNSSECYLVSRLKFRNVMPRCKFTIQPIQKCNYVMSLSDKNWRLC